MNDIVRVFENEGLGKVRIVNIDGNPWFVGRDICEMFGDTNYRRSLGRLDSDERVCHKVNTSGGKQNMTLINESGLYSLLFFMQPQKAKGVSQNAESINQRIKRLREFKHWVTSEVLPSIRKTGRYSINDRDENKRILLDIVGAEKEEELVALLEEYNLRSYFGNLLG